MVRERIFREQVIPAKAPAGWAQVRPDPRYMDRLGVLPRRMVRGFFTRGETQA